MCANGDFLLLDAAGNLFLRTGVKEANPTGNEWMKVDNVEAHTVNCGFRGYFWIVRSNGVVAMRTGVTAALPKGDGW
jgi:hypothetical protein